MGRIFDETLTLTNLPAHLKAGYSDGYIAKADVIYAKDGKSQADINDELAQSIGNVSVPVTGVKSGDKILALADKQLSATLSLTYEQKTGDTAKKIYLNGIGGATIASIDATDFVKDKVVSSAELVETAEAGVSVAVPYIKLVFNDASTPIRFSVKSLVDVYTGANLKLSTAYSTTTGVAPANGVSVDAAVKNIATRLGTIEDKTYVNSVGGKTGAITLASGSTTAGAVNFTIDSTGKISATTVLTGYAKTTDISSTYLTKTDASTTYATKASVATKTVAEATETSDGYAKAYDVQQKIITDIQAAVSGYTTTSDHQALSDKVTANTTEIANALNSVTASGDTYVSASVNTKASKTQKITVATTTHAVSSATKDADGLATAYGAKSYTDTKVADLKKTVDAINTAYLTATVADTTVYDEWDVIAGKSTSTTTATA